MPQCAAEWRITMNENNTIRNDEISIDIKRLFHAVWSRKWLILTVSVLCAIVVWTVTFFFVTPTYEASAMFYVNNMNQTNSSQNGLSSSDIAASKNLVESYIIILRTKESLTSVIEYAGIDLHYETLSDMITAEAVDETEILNVIVTSDDPEEAAKLANAIIAVLPGRITSIIFALIHLKQHLYSLSHTKPEHIFELFLIVLNLQPSFNFYFLNFINCFSNKLSMQLMIIF